MKADSSVDPGQALRDLEIAPHRRLAVGQTRLGDEDRIVSGDFPRRERTLKSEPALVQNGYDDFLARLLLDETYPALLEVDMMARHCAEVSRADARFKGHDKEIPRSLEAEEVRVRGVAIVAHPGAIRSPRSEAAILRLPGFPFGHRLGEIAAKAWLVVERREERRRSSELSSRHGLFAFCFLSFFLSGSSGMTSNSTA